MKFIMRWIFETISGKSLQYFFNGCQHLQKITAFQLKKAFFRFVASILMFDRETWRKMKRKEKQVEISWDYRLLNCYCTKKGIFGFKENVPFLPISRDWNKKLFLCPRNWEVLGLRNANLQRRKSGWTTRRHHEDIF